MAEGLMRCVKYLLFAFNLLFLISGIFAIVGAVLLMTQLRQYVSDFGQMTDPFLVFVIIVGVIIVVISFFGCCGAVRENYCLVILFGAFLCLILLLEGACLVAVLVTRNKIETVIEQHFLDDLKKYSAEGEDESVVFAWDNRQHKLHCCGALNYTDWTRATHLNGSVPQSCCRNPDHLDHDHPDHCNVTGLAKAPEDYAGKLIFTSGCIEKMKEWVLRNIGIFVGVASGLTVFQIVGIILAACLAWDIKKNYEYV